MSKTYIHIGLPKTGTSLLQKNYFPKVRNVNYFRNLNFRMFGEISKKEFFLLSHEGLSGQPWNQAWRHGKPNCHKWLESFELTIQNLKMFQPKANIIVVFRKHGDLLVSLYKQYLHEGGVLSFEEFYNPDGVIREEDLNFRFRIDYLKENFENVDILSFEKFKSQGISYFAKYFDSIGFTTVNLDIIKPENPGISGKKIDLLRKTNIFYSRFPKKIKFVFFRLGFTPRNIFQEKLKFWKSEDDENLNVFRRNLNIKFIDDWKYVTENEKII